MQKIIAVSLLWLFASVAHAGCEGLADKLNAELYPVENEARDMRFSTCKVWPFDPSKSIVALVHFQEGSSFAVPPNKTEGLYDLTVLLVSSDSGKILNRLVQEGEFTSDAIMLNGISIDTAPYNLAKNIRAFGVRAGFSNSSALNSIVFEKISLYVLQGSSLKPVLGGLVVTEKLVEQNGDCNISSTVTNRTLAIAETTTRGYADLILREKKIKDTESREKGECKQIQKALSKNYVLHFTGESYALPGEIQHIN